MESSGRTLVCSVLFLDIAEYSMKPVAEQLELKQAFNGLLAAALEGVTPRDRVVLDTGDGAAVTFVGDPEDALFAAMTLRERLAAHAGGGLAVRLGVNLGPVRLIRDLNDRVNIIGDGINVAQRVMSFAQPGQLLVSRSFYEVVSCLSRDYAALFRHEGARTDKHVREHEVYSVAAGTPAARRVADGAARSQGVGTASGWLAARGPLGLQRSTLVVAPLVFLLIAGSGLALRPARTPEADPAGLPPSAAPSSHVGPAAAAPAAPTAPAAAAARPGPASSAAAATPRAGRIQLAIAPWGEVFVDGVRRGVSPPLATLDVPPGEHTVEIRNASFASRVERVVVRPGGQIRIRHRFR